LVILATLAAFKDVYEGQIDGDFHGRDGDTVYKLRDGYIIEQRSWIRRRGRANQSNFTHFGKQPFFETALYADQTNLATLLAEHAREIARQVKRAKYQSSSVQ
jgi:hypothetical protein